MARTNPFPVAAFGRWFDETVLDLGRQFRWSYLPPLMVYLASGVSGLAAIVDTFFVKEYRGLRHRRPEGGEGAFERAFLGCEPIRVERCAYVRLWL